MIGRLVRPGQLLAAAPAAARGVASLAGSGAGAAAGVAVQASASAASMAITAPVVSQFLGCTPIGPVAWAMVVAAAATGTLVAALAPRWLGSVA